jgi:lipopolysaccharide export system permease protein
MMTIVNRYIAKSVIIATFLVLLVVTALSFLISLLEELRDIGVGDYHFFEALMHAVLLMPHNVYQFFPMLMMLGGILGLGALASHQELIVMQASGVSVYRIAWAVLQGALALVMIATFLGEYVAPHASFLASQRKDSAQNRGQAVATTAGVWIHEGNNFIHIDRVTGQHHLEGVTRYEFDLSHQLLNAYYVESMDFENQHWQLHHMVTTAFLPNRTKSQSFAEATWTLKLNPNLLNVGVIEAPELSLPQLRHYFGHFAQDSAEANRFRFEFWKRIFQPLTTLVMILLAIPFVFVAPRSVTMGWRILLGVMIGFAFYIVNSFLGQLSVVYQLSPFFAALLPIVLFASVGGVLMTRAGR